MQTIRETALELLAKSGAQAGCFVKVKEQPHCHRPAWNVYVKPECGKRGKHLFSVITTTTQR